MDYHLACQIASRAVLLTSSSHLAPLLASKRFRDSVPEEISLIAFDYGVQPTPSYWLDRKITHVSCDWSEIGCKAIEVLFSLIEGENAPSVIYEPVFLVDGDTVAQWKPI